MLSQCLITVVTATIVLASSAGSASLAEAAIYYEAQTDFSERTVPGSSYRWDKDQINGCIYKDDSVPNSYYVWAKLSVQNWRQALREYTGSADDWKV
jgi:hypothetical protein